MLTRKKPPLESDGSDPFGSALASTVRCSNPGSTPNRRLGPCHNTGIANQQDARMTALLKVGLMGYGFAGETFHAPVIDHCGRATVSAIATGKPERAQADYPNATIVEDFDALLALDELDAS
jgi:hypothetical protein